LSAPLCLKDCTAKLATILHPLQIGFYFGICCYLPSPSTHFDFSDQYHHFLISVINTITSGGHIAPYVETLLEH